MAECDELRAAARHLLAVIDMPGPGAPLTASARLLNIASDPVQRDALLEADAMLDRALGPPAISPWRQVRATGMRWTVIASAFPSLRGCPEIISMALEVIAERAGTTERESMYGAGKGHAARFMLSLFRRSAFAPFDVVAAFSAWDQPHREAFISWAKDPWWP